MARPRKENADYFSHDTNMRSHRKVIALRTKYLLEWYAVYNMLLEHIGSCDYFIAKWDIIEQEIIAGDFGVPVEKLIDIVSFCDRLGLIQIDWETIKCESLTDRLQDLITKRDRERNRVTVAETTQTVAESPQSKLKESKLKNSKEKEIKEYNNITIPSRVREFINTQAKNMISIQSQINKRWEEYYSKNAIDYERMKKEILLEVGDAEVIAPAILQYIPTDDFRKTNIWSIAKLLEKNKQGIKYRMVILEKAKQKQDKKTVDSSRYTI